MLLAMSVLIILFMDIYRLNPVWAKSYTIRMAGLSLIYAGYIRAWRLARPSVERPASWTTRPKRRFWDWFDSLLPWRKKPEAPLKVCPEYDTLYRQLQMSMRRGRYFARFLEEHGAPPETVEYAKSIVRHGSANNGLTREQASSILDALDASSAFDASDTKRGSLL